MESEGVNGWFAKLTGEWLSKVGFPIAVTAYLLFSLGAKVDRLVALQEKALILLEHRDNNGGSND